MSEILDNVINFEKKKKTLEKVYDAKGKRIAHLFRSRFTKKYVYRRKFGKLGIPPLKQTLEADTLGKARTEAEILVQRHKNKHLGIDDTQVFGAQKYVSFKSLIDKVEKNYTNSDDCRSETKAKHKFFWKLFREEIGHMNVWTWSDEEFKNFLKREKKKRKRKTFMDYAKHMNLLFRLAFKWKILPYRMTFENPDSGPLNKPRVYTSDEWDRIWEVSNDNLRDVLVLLGECGMRLREALHLEWSRIHLETGLVHLGPEHVKTGSKTGEGRDFIVSPHALERLKARCERTRHMGSNFVFPGKSRIYTSPKTFHYVFDGSKPQDDIKTAFKKALEKAKIEGRATRHDFRHTWYTEQAKRGTPAAKSGAYAGTRAVTVDRVYTHLNAKDTRELAGTIKIGEKKK
jgi:integrase